MFSQELVKKARSGDANAMRELAMALVKGDGITQDVGQALSWIEKAAELGNAAAQSDMAELCRNDEDFESAFNWEQKAAKQGLPGAQYNLAIHYREGMGAPFDPKQQFYWFHQAAKNGHTGAKHDLALCYAKGNGTTQDYEQAAYWWEQASDEDHAESKASLGSCYYFGLGVPEDKGKGFQLWKEAAAQGSGTAKNLLNNNPEPPPRKITFEANPCLIKDRKSPSAVAPDTKPAFATSTVENDKKICVKCGKSLEPISRFCNDCGTPVAATPVAQPAPIVPPVKDEKKICVTCGKTLEPISRFCNDCGTPVAVASVAQPVPDVFAVEFDIQPLGFDASSVPFALTESAAPVQPTEYTQFDQFDLNDNKPFYKESPLKLNVEENSERLILQNLNSPEYEHPLDRTTLKALKSIPLFPKLLEMIDVPYNNLRRLEFMGSRLRVGEKQLPAIYRIMREACDILDVDEPAIYIDSGSDVNAYVMCSDKPILCISNTLLDIMDDDELMFVIGHELAHIKSGHVLYDSVGWVLKQGIINVMFSSIPGLSLLSDAVAVSLNYAYYKWSQAAEFTCDRGGYLACQNFTASCRALMKLACPSQKYLNELNLNEFLEQGRTFEDIDSSGLGNVQKIILSYGSTHPWMVSRTRELLRFAESGEYSNVIQRKTEGKTFEYSADVSSSNTTGAVEQTYNTARNLAENAFSRFRNK